MVRLRLKKMEAKALWEGFVDKTIFQRVGEVLKKNHSTLKPARGINRHPYILSGVSFCMTCGDYMPGKSATGRNGKIPYYEHSWATKRDTCLTKKSFKCEPYRVQARILEPLVWGEFCKFLENREFVLDLMKKVNELHSQNDVMKEKGRFKAKLYGINSQLEGLAERLLTMEDFNLDQRLIPFESFEHFAAHARRVLQENPDYNLKRMFLQKFIKRVEIGVDSIKIFWNLDKDHYNREIALTSIYPASASAEAGPLKLIAKVGSHTLKNGHPTRT